MVGPIEYRVNSKKLVKDSRTTRILKYNKVSHHQSPPRRGVLVRVSNLRISRSNFSIPVGPLAAGTFRAPCLSNRYVNKFFFSSARPSRRVNKWVSSRKTSCAAMIAAAADSRTMRDDRLFRDCKKNHQKPFFPPCDNNEQTVIRVVFNRGSSSSAISAGRRRMNLPMAISPKAYVADLISSSSDEGAGSALKTLRVPCIVVKPYTGSNLDVKASRIALVPSRTYWMVSLCIRIAASFELTLILLQ